MQMRTSGKNGVVVLAMVICLLMAFGTAALADPAPKEVKVGLMYSLTGPASPIGRLVG